ncbi:hypothetical protein FE257_009598 [Aspergillus nanangensis]|uniref:Uncharacterized protein n=1 Tax=Aspergillus nanangensis TaxID=2582783 RepID=A0AAD4CLI7_ASPNN|nr:hypothetical protein FE257_009598 [Aspergillus nanangensis]
MILPGNAARLNSGASRSSPKSRSRTTTKPYHGYAIVVLISLSPGQISLMQFSTVGAILQPCTSDFGKRHVWATTIGQPLEGTLPPRAIPILAGPLKGTYGLCSARTEQFAVETLLYFMVYGHEPYDDMILSAAEWDRRFGEMEFPELNRNEVFDVDVPHGGYWVTHLWRSLNPWLWGSEIFVSSSLWRFGVMLALVVLHYRLMRGYLPKEANLEMEIFPAEKE